jgi:A/G-specific adenine glycosylase
VKRNVFAQALPPFTLRLTVRPKIPTPSAKTVNAKIVRWFGAHQRDLPWRRTQDPYAIWISEIMLQQTQVKTVIPYFERWMRELPTVTAFAQAKPERALKLWEGLGYYRRARHAQEAAQHIVSNFEGRFPENFADVLELPGIGRYTAGAICSVAFNAPTPILDGNVVRVLTRLYGVTGNPRDKKINSTLWTLAEALVACAADRSSLNQGLMELGALICVPRQPKCDRCPVRGICNARQTHRVDLLPMLDSRPAITKRRFAAFIVRQDDRFLVAQRPAGVVNGLLWEFPNVEGEDRGTDFAALDTKPICQVRHSITRYRILLEAYAARLLKPQAPPNTHWRTLAQLDKLPFASAHRKILQQLRAERTLLYDQ